MRALDVAVFTDDAEGLAPHAGASHHPPAAHAQIRLHVGCLKPPFGSPPAGALGGIRQRRKNPFRWGLNGDFLDDHSVRSSLVHRLFSTYLRSSRRLAPQNAS